MKFRIVVTQAQSHGIGRPARFCHLFGRKVAARHRHAEMPARLGRSICGPRNVDFLFARHGTRRACQNQTESIERCIVSHCAEPVTF